MKNYLLKIPVGIVILATFICISYSCTNLKKDESKTCCEKSTPCLKNVEITENYFTVEGDTIVFKGLCLEDLGSLNDQGHWGEEYIHQASLWNVNVVRFPVHPVHMKNMGKDKYIAELKKGVEWAKKYNMYSIIDWHIIGNLKDEKWQHPMYETTKLETLDFWATIAKEFKDEPAIAFYELYNEPTVFNGQLGEMTWNELMDEYARIIDTVRAYDTTTITLLGGLNWAYDISGLKDYDPGFKNNAYTAHPYPQKNEEPWFENWDNAFGFASEKYPIVCTEFGYAYADQVGAHIPVISDDHYGEEILEYFNSRNLSYTAWCFSWNWHPTLLKDSTYTPQVGQGEFFKKEFIKHKF
jgi:hypothetical protein